MDGGKISTKAHSILRNSVLDGVVSGGNYDIHGSKRLREQSTPPEVPSNASGAFLKAAYRKLTKGFKPASSKNTYLKKTMYQKQAKASANAFSICCKPSTESGLQLSRH